MNQAAVAKRKNQPTAKNAVAWHLHPRGLLRGTHLEKIRSRARPAG